MRTFRRSKHLVLLMICICLFQIVVPIILNFPSIAATPENQWDISTDGSNGMIATFSDNGTLAITGSRNNERLGFHK